MSIEDECPGNKLLWMSLMCQLVHCGTGAAGNISSCKAAVFHVVTMRNPNFRKKAISLKLKLDLTRYIGIFIMKLTIG